MIREQKDKVRFILEHYPETRNDDFLLNLKVKEQFGNTFFSPYQVEMLRKFFEGYDGISRARRLLQEKNEELRPTDPKIRRKRMKMADKVKDELGYLTKENVNVVVDAKVTTDKYQDKLFDIPVRY